MQNSLLIPVSAWASWQADEKPDLSFVDPMLRRRLSPMDRAALHVASRCATPGEPVHVVFASRHGELARSAALLSEIAQNELPSPMGFSLSVLNALPGLYSMAVHNIAPSTAISAGEATFALALLEAAAQAWAKPEATILLLCADDPPPEIYADAVDMPREPYAVAVRLEAARATHSVRCEWRATSGNDNIEAAPRAFLRCLNEHADTHWAGPDQTWHWRYEQAA